MDSLKKLFDICKYNKLDNAINDNINHPKQREYARKLIRIFERWGISFETYRSISQEILDLNQEYKGLW